jgi:hypothetical protein
MGHPRQNEVSMQLPTWKLCIHTARQANPWFAGRFLYPSQEVSKVSHIVIITAEARDPVAISTACRRLKLPEPTSAKTKLLSGEVTQTLPIIDQGNGADGKDGRDERSLSAP